MENLSIAPASYDAAYDDAPIAVTPQPKLPPYAYQNLDCDGDGILNEQDIGWKSAFARQFCIAEKAKLQADLKKGGIAINNEATLDAIVKQNFQRKVQPYVGKNSAEIYAYNRMLASKGVTPVILVG